MDIGPIQGVVSNVVQAKGRVDQAIRQPSQGFGPEGFEDVLQQVVSQITVPVVSNGVGGQRANAVPNRVPPGRLHPTTGANLNPVEGVAVRQAGLGGVVVRHEVQVEGNPCRESCLMGEDVPKGAFSQLRVEYPPILR